MLTSDRLPVEREHHQKAFELYYGLGETRSLKTVAAKLGVSLNSLKLWSRSFDWQQRVQERNAEAARQIADRTTQTTVDERGRNRKIVQMALVRLAKAIADGKVRMQLGDLERLVRLQSFLDSAEGPDGAVADYRADPLYLQIRDMDDETLDFAILFFEAMANPAQKRCFLRAWEIMEQEVAEDQRAGAELDGDCALSGELEEVGPDDHH